MKFDSLKLKGFSKTALKENWLDMLLYLICGLPFLQIIPLPSDTQPYGLIVAAVYLCARRKRLAITQFHKIMLLPILLAAVLALVGVCCDETVTIMMLARKTYNYAAMFLISLALVNSFVKTKGMQEDWVKCLILIWLFVGLVQLLINRQFLSFLISNYRTTANRGVAGLASEPSFYGYVMVFFFILASEFERHRLLYQGICIFQIVALAQSAVTIVYLAVFVFVLVIREIVCFRKNSPEEKKKKLILGVVALGALLIGGGAVLIFAGNSRMVRVFVNLLSNMGRIRSLSDLYAVDESVAERLEGIIIAFQGFFQNFGMPNGFGEIRIDGVVYQRVMSGFGSVIYEMGFMGVAIILATSWVLVKGLKYGTVLGVGTVIIMFSAVQYGSPVFIFVLSCALYAQGREKCTVINTDKTVKRIWKKTRKKRKN